MAKPIRFPLEMANGLKVRTIEELREHFDLMKILSYYLDGKLLTWLNDRYYEFEAVQISELNCKLPDFKARLCEILGVKDQSDSEIDMGALERRSAKIAKLKHFIDDEDIINKVDSVAFNQAELAELLDDNVFIIYLFGERFNVPISKENVTYIGIGTPLPVVTMNSRVPGDFFSKSIIFKDIIFEDCYRIDAKNNIKIQPYDGEVVTLPEIAVMAVAVVEFREARLNTEMESKSKYKVSPLFDFILNENDCKASERLFGIIQTELSALSYDVDKRSKPLLKILKQERLTDIFEKYLSTIA